MSELDPNPIKALTERLAELEDILDTIHMHGVEREHGWVMVPKTEWEQAFERAGLRNYSS